MKTKIELRVKWKIPFFSQKFNSTKIPLKESYDFPLLNYDVLIGDCKIEFIALKNGIQNIVLEFNGKESVLENKIKDFIFKE